MHGYKHMRAVPFQHNPPNNMDLGLHPYRGGIAASTQKPAQVDSLGTCWSWKSERILLPWFLIQCNILDLSVSSQYLMSYFFFSLSLSISPLLFLLFSLSVLILFTASSLSLLLLSSSSDLLLFIRCIPSQRKPINIQVPAPNFSVLFSQGPSHFKFPKAKR